MGGRGSNSGKGKGSYTINTNDLPALKGTEKQVKWANDIRKDYVNRINEFLQNDEIYWNPVLKTTAEDFARSMLHYGVLNNYDSSKQSSLYENLPKSVKSNREADDYVNDYIDKIFKPGNAVRKDAKAEGKAKGMSSGEAREYSLKAQKQYYKKYIAEFTKFSLNKAGRASDWIDKYKNKYGKK